MKQDPDNSTIRAVIPMVTETTDHGERAFDIYSMLLHNRIIVLGEEINGQTANRVVAQLLYLTHKDPEQPIQMYIHSPGGEVYAGLAIYDAMQTVPNPIATVSVGFTASFGTVILTGGTKGHRYALPNATIHMHQPHGGASGQATDIEIQAREALRLKKELNQIFVKQTGQPLDVIERDLDRDRYLTAEQAIKYGLIDHVMEPTGLKNLNV